MLRAMVEVATSSTNRGHHPDSPSSLQASEACPLFENEQREADENSASAKGTLQHTAVETGDLTILHGDEAMTAAVEKALRYRARVVDYFKAQGIDPVSVKEKYLPVGDDIVTDKDGRKWRGITGGYSDDILFSSKLGEAHVLDWKFGAVPVTPAADNVQGFAYVLGVFADFPQLQFVTMHFFHPYQNWSEEDQERLYIHTFTRANIPRMELRIRTIIAQKKSAQAKPRAKVDLCIWCAKKGDCPANKAAIIPLEGKYEDLVCPDIVAPHQLALPSQFAAAYKFAGQVELWAKAVKARCTDAALKDGMEIPGYAIVRRQTRSIQSVKLLLQGAVKNGVRFRELLDIIDVPLTKLEALVKAKAVPGKGALAIRKLASDLEESGATVKGNPYHFLREIKSPAESQATIEI